MNNGMGNQRSVSSWPVVTLALVVLSVCMVFALGAVLDGTELLNPASADKIRAETEYQRELDRIDVETKRKQNEVRIQLDAQLAAAQSEVERQLIQANAEKDLAIINAEKDAQVAALQQEVESQKQWDIFWRDMAYLTAIVIVIVLVLVIGAIGMRWILISYANARSGPNTTQPPSPAAPLPNGPSPSAFPTRGQPTTGNPDWGKASPVYGKGASQPSVSRVRADQAARRRKQVEEHEAARKEAVQWATAALLRAQLDERKSFEQAEPPALENARSETQERAERETQERIECEIKRRQQVLERDIAVVILANKRRKQMRTNSVRLPPHSAARPPSGDGQSEPDKN